MGLKMYKLDFGWEIAVPEDWIMEKKEAGSCMFYPSDPEDETTLYASAVHSEVNRVPAPEHMMQEAFDKSVPENAETIEITSSLHCKAFKVSGSGICRIGAGFYTEGDLLSLNVYAKNEEKANEAASGFAHTKLRG
ncbi:MAG: hypothetical protein HDT43_09210 [Ruminococcaceae bacterium]|nr:hypothetical protein [Oscillospiraceae bacterium]